jgi:hypothetical protein
MDDFLNKRNFLGSSKDFLSHGDKSYTVIVQYTDGTSSKHNNIKNPWEYKRKALKNLYVEDVKIVSE